MAVMQLLMINSITALERVKTKQYTNPPNLECHLCSENKLVSLEQTSGSVDVNTVSYTVN